MRPTASAPGLIINFSIALFRVYTEFGIELLFNMIGEFELHIWTLLSNISHYILIP